MLDNFVFPQTAEITGIIFKQDDAPHFGNITCRALIIQFLDQWIRMGSMTTDKL
jgi:hypothetical protein